MTPFPIHLAPLGGSRYDHITWYPPQVLWCNHKLRKIYHPRFNTRVFDPPRHAAFETYVGKQIQYLLNWQSKISQFSLCKFMQYHLWSIFHVPLLAIQVYPKIMFAKRGFHPITTKFPRKFLLAQAQTLHKHPESCHVGVRPTRLLTWATNGQQPADTKGNVEQKPWHDIPLYCSSWWFHQPIWKI